MNDEVYVVRLISQKSNVNRVLAVINNIDVVDKIAYQLHEVDSGARGGEAHNKPNNSPNSSLPLPTHL